MSLPQRRGYLRRKKQSRFPGSVKRNTLIGLTVLVCSGLTLWIVFQEPVRNDKPALANSDAAETVVSDSKKDWVIVGGVSRPASDVQLAKFSKSDEQDKQVNFDYGQQKGIDPKTNAETTSIYEALTNDTGAERLSPFLPAAPFDADAYAQDPQKYLSVFEPSRVWQSAQPETGVPVLAPATEIFQAMKQGESIALKVVSSPGKPVTFTSFDLGAFNNNLNSISVAADETGVASANFTATPGTIAEVKILAASPVASGNVRFTVNVTKVSN